MFRCVSLNFVRILHKKVWRFIRWIQRACLGGGVPRQTLGRAIGGWLAVHQLGYFSICISNPFAWGLALCYCVFMVTRVLKKEE